MNIFYRSRTKSWYQHDCPEPIHFGGHRHILTYESRSSEADKAFSVQLKNGRAGPLVGIMAGSTEKSPITGNLALFRSVQEYLSTLGGLSFIFTPEKVEKESIEGWMFMQNCSSWKKAVFPHPDVVFNRVPFRSLEATSGFRKAVNLFKEKSIPLFNPCFLGKYDIHLLFKEHPVLSLHLPETILLTGPHALSSFSEMYKRVYLKPSFSWGGNGIFLVSFEAGGQVSVQSPDKNEFFADYSSFWEAFGEKLMKREYIVQEAISPIHYKGSRFDFRVLAHADKDKYVITGIAVRHSGTQEITTHLLKGGRLLPYSEVESEQNTRFLQKIVSSSGECLTSNLGFFGEFSIDAGVSKDGSYYIYEVNSKPMSFDENWIEEKRIRNLCRLFMQLSGFD